MPSLNFLNSAVINVGGTAGGLLKQAGVFERKQEQVSRITITVPGTGVTFSADATMSENHAYENTPTTFPVEDGSTISDHVILNPETFTCTGVVTDTPFIDRNNLSGLLETELSAAISGFIPPLGVTAATGALALYNLVRGAPKPSLVAFEALCRIRGGTVPYKIPPSLFSIHTKYRRYDNMVITSLSFPVDAGTDGLLTFNMTCARIVIVTPQSENVAVKANAASSANQKSLGEQDGIDKNSEFYKNRRKGFHAVVDPIEAIKDYFGGAK